MSAADEPTDVCGVCHEPLMAAEGVDSTGQVSWSHESDGTPLCCTKDGVAWILTWGHNEVIEHWVAAGVEVKLRNLPEGW